MRSSRRLSTLATLAAAEAASVFVLLLFACPTGLRPRFDAFCFFSLPLSFVFLPFATTALFLPFLPLLTPFDFGLRFFGGRPRPGLETGTESLVFSFSTLLSTGLLSSLDVVGFTASSVVVVVVVFKLLEESILDTGSSLLEQEVGRGMLSPKEEEDVVGVGSFSEVAEVAFEDANEERLVVEVLAGVVVVVEGDTLKDLSSRIRS